MVPRDCLYLFVPVLVPILAPVNYWKFDRKSHSDCMDFGEGVIGNLIGSCSGVRKVSDNLTDMPFTQNLLHPSFLMFALSFLLFFHSIHIFVSLLKKLVLSNTILRENTYPDAKMNR
jgi:hypothetical protein